MSETLVTFLVICVKTSMSRKTDMTFNPQAIFANLTEKERVHGHHSAEGRAIRTLSRALSGWSVGNLSSQDVIVLCDQAIEEWLKTRLELSQWSSRTSLELLQLATEKNLLMTTEAERLKQIVYLREKSEPGSPSAAEVEAALACSIEIVENYWS